MFITANASDSVIWCDVMAASSGADGDWIESFIPPLEHKRREWNKKKKN